MIEKLRVVSLEEPIEREMTKKKKEKETKISVKDFPENDIWEDIYEVIIR